jgi:hypothetical protein
MNVSAKLKIMLTAGETQVAESEDPILWQKVLAAITAAGSGPRAPGLQTTRAANGLGGQDLAMSLQGLSGEVDRMAQELGVEPAILIGACDPTTEPPYLSLNPHCWESLKESTPPRGAGAVSAMALAATLACLWFRHAKLGTPTPAQVQAILKTVGASEMNPTRAVRNCDWLQARAGGIILNPAEISKAIKIAHAFCTREHVLSK